MDFQKLQETCEAEEQKYRFAKFSRQDSLDLLLIMNEQAKRFQDPVGIAITINGLLVAQFFQDGSMPDSALWLKRKHNTVDLHQHSSLWAYAWLQNLGETPEDRKLDVKAHAFGGGGFPIHIEGVGVIGSICVSGLPNHFDDHQLILDSMDVFNKTIEGK
ncbi:MAG: heme-binding protein [Lachnospiraceae bacterium]